MFFDEKGRNHFEFRHTFNRENLRVEGVNS